MLLGFSRIKTARRSHTTWLWWTPLLCVWIAGCPGFAGPGSVIPPDDGPGTNTNSNGSIDDPPGGDGNTNDNTDSPDSVQDVTDGPGDSGDPGQPLPQGGIVFARVRNESNFRADVTLRFILDGTVVHLAFARVLGNTVTTIASPSDADVVEASGVDERGLALTSATLLREIDFDDDTPALYVITAESVGGDPGPGDGGEVEIRLLEPQSDVTLTLGSLLVVQWDDTASAPGAVVQIGLRLAVSTDPSDMIPLGPAVAAALDGLNDELVVVLQNLDPGTYEVAGEITDGDASAISIAPGLVEVIAAAGNSAPSLSILAPTTLVELNNGDPLTIVWEDEDEDDNATITFSLVASDPAILGVGPFVLSAPLAEDPDPAGGQPDTENLTIGSEVLPGLYDLLGRIDDGELVGTDRVEGVVRILPEPANAPPQLVLIEPATDLDISPGGSFVVRWVDSDANDNARISLLLDPDLDTGSLDGNEWVLVASLSEDDDGVGDMLTLGIPAGVEEASYRLAATISDGVTELATWAPGLIHFGSDPSTGPSPELSLTEPSDELRIHMGDSFEVQLDTTDIAETADVRLYLTNAAYGGTIRADVTPPQFPHGITITTTLPGVLASIPNSAWPRRFNLEAELRINSETTLASTAPGSIWIRQEIEITSVEMVNFTCAPGEEPAPPREFVGVEISWYGGGFEQREPHAEASFWFSNDGQVPTDNQPDSTHRIVHRALESPDVQRVILLEIGEVVGVPNSVGNLVTRLTPDWYRVIAAVDSEAFGRITSTHPVQVNVCRRLFDVEQLP